ncbi:uncharacterized protein K02A2.6-like [Sitodiplosis mosellana]|uniref:uncharacterized protein K02A2.6-like n=1 Tax=Sitodiplosis mosellana TaxID=263140 RepID=UPI0024451251|nr:uncharacterized protein K02A2.6-like [Sitodiplosis mosellana]
MDCDIENLVKNCRDCQRIRPESKKVIVHHWMRPNEPFERVHADFAGPIMGKYLFILVDAYTKWPEVRVIPNITAETTIAVCRDIFATFGIPKYFVSDWGTQFVSGDFQAFLKVNGVEHRKGAPYHPATNGQAERYVQTFKNKIKTLKCSRNDLKKNIANILLAYRRAIHPATGKSPSMLMFGRQMKNRLDLMLPNEHKQEEEHVNIGKNFNQNDRVAVRDYLSNEKWKFGTVSQKFGKLHYEVQLEDGRNWKRHVDQMRKVGDEIISKQSNVPSVSNEPTKTPTQISDNVETSMQAQSCVNGPTHNQPTFIAEEPSKESLPCNSNLPSPSMPSAEVMNDKGVPSHNESERVMRKSTRVRRPPERLQYH